MLLTSKHRYRLKLRDWSGVARLNATTSTTETYGCSGWLFYHHFLNITEQWKYRFYVIKCLEPQEWYNPPKFNSEFTPGKTMVGRWSLPFGMASFQGLLLLNLQGVSNISHVFCENMPPRCWKKHTTGNRRPGWDSALSSLHHSEWSSWKGKTWITLTYIGIVTNLETPHTSSFFSRAKFP